MKVMAHLQRMDETGTVGRLTCEGGCDAALTMCSLDTLRRGGGFASDVRDGQG